MIIGCPHSTRHVPKVSDLVLYFKKELIQINSSLGIHFSGCKTAALSHSVLFIFNLENSQKSHGAVFGQYQT